MKKFFSILSKVIITVILLNALFVTAKEKLPKNINLDNNEAAASEEYTNSNCVVYLKENGIKTFPFIFGNSIYLYSIDEDKTYLIACSKIPTFSYSPNMALSGKYLYYQKSDLWGNVTSTIYRRELKTSKVEKGKIDNDYEFIAIGENYFWLEEDGIYKYSTDGKKHALLKGDKEWTYEDRPYEEILLYDNKIFAMGEGSIDVISEESGEITRLPLEGGKYYYANCIEKLDDNTIIFADACSGKLVKYNLKTYEIEELADVADPEWAAPYWNKICVYEDNVYCNDDEYNIVAVNYNTGEKNTVIETRKYLPKEVKTSDIDEWYDTNYCKDYITIQLLYNWAEEDGRRVLFIFDYDGNLVKEIDVEA